MRERVFTYVLTLPLLLCACASSHAPPAAAAHSVAGGAVAITQSAGAVAVPYVPSGTTFDATIDQPIDTRISVPGEPVAATVTAPVVAFNGDIVIPAGAKLEGHIASLGTESAPRIDLAFDTLVLPAGHVPVTVRILSVEQTRYRSVVAPGGATNMQRGATQPQGQQRGTPAGPVHISIPVGSTVQVALTSPIVDVRSIH
jgi:hypothetical protein